VRRDLRVDAAGHGGGAVGRLLHQQHSQLVATDPADHVGFAC
jgi:hypothetical protein